MRDAWLIWFEDAGEDPELFSGEGAEKAAHRRFKAISTTYNCHLFRTIEINPALAGEYPHTHNGAEGMELDHSGNCPHLQDENLGCDCGVIPTVHPKDAEIAKLRDALNRIANGCRLPVNEHQRVVLKVATEALGDAYKPFPMQIV